MTMNVPDSLTLYECSFLPDPNHPPDLNAVKEACLVVDVLGEDYRYVGSSQILFKIRARSWADLT